MDTGRSRQSLLARAAVRPALLAFGAYHLGLGIWMVLGPRSFYEKVAPYGSFSDHFVRDLATFYLALGAVQLVAAARRRWQLPVIAFTAIQYALHALNHLWDIGDTHPRSKGVVNFVVIALLAAGSWWLLRAAAQEEDR